MKSNANFALLCFAVLYSLHIDLVEGKRLRLRPLSSKEVYRVLREYGEEDVVPEGRVVTQGIAAVTGFTLGLTKGIGGSILYDIVTSNATIDYLNSLNFSALIPTYTYNINLPTINYTAVSESLPTINVTALTNSLPIINVTALANSIPTINTTAFWSLFGNKNVVAATPGASPAPSTTQEICFTSRSLDEIALERAYDGQEYDDGDRYEDKDEIARQVNTLPTGSIPTYSSEPSTPPNSFTSTLTSTPTNPVTCVVLHKPAGRRRRRNALQ